MEITFDKDPAGSILEYAYLTLEKNNKLISKRSAWVKNNLNSGKGHIWNNIVDKANLRYELAIGRDKNTVRTQLNRIFSKLEIKDLIEIDPEDDNPQTLHYRITELGKEAILEKTYLEIIFGFQYIVDKWKNSVAKIHQPGVKGIGTGFLITDTLIATAKHVVDKMTNIEIRFEDGMIFKPSDIIIPKKMKELDIALLEIDNAGKNLKPFSIQPTHELLDEIVIFGYPPIPITNDAYLVVNKGEISSMPTLRNDIQVMIVSTTLRGGHSGGPIVNDKGHVVGIVSENLFEQLSKKEKSIAEGLGFSAALGSQWLLDLKNGKV